MKCPECDLDIDISIDCESGSEEESLARIASSLEELVTIQKATLQLATDQWKKWEREDNE